MASKIVSIELRSFDSTYARPIATSLGARTRLAGFLVEVTTEDGLVGHGWTHGTPFISGETQSSIEAMFREVIAPLAVGENALDIAAIMEALEERLAFNWRAKAGLDLALHDVAAKAAGVPLWRLLGGRLRESVDCIRMVGVDTPERMAGEVEAMRRQGFRHFKLKIDAAADDEARVRTVAAVLGKDGRLVLDANQAYAPKAIIGLMERLHDCPVEVLEQPVAVHDLKGLALVRRSVSAFVEADECVRTAADACRVIENDAADIISLKVHKMGGLYFTRKIADLCQSFGIPNLVGATVGSSIVDLAQTHLACSHPNITAFGAEIGESERMRDDPARGLTIVDGRSFAPDRAGIGAEIGAPGAALREAAG